MRRLSILGSTGSIGKQTLEVVRKAPSDFTVEALTCGSDIDTLFDQIREFRPKICSVENSSRAKELSQKLKNSGIDSEVLTGKEGNIVCACTDSCDTVVGAIVGFAGLEPVYHAILSGKDIALANKETLVAGGDVIMPLIREKGVSMLPIDSEHSAIWQCLKGEERADLDRILITASGGPFRGKSYEELKSMTVEQALKHPNWSMGKKVTIDSASLVNKGLEVIEAKWLFDVSAKDITVLIHPESIVHSMVQYTDGAVIAQMGIPDMKLPIQYALFHPDRRPMKDNRVDFFKLEKLTFYKPDTETCKGLKFAYEAIDKGGNAPTVFNAANEFAVKRFLDKKIGFTGIYDIIEAALNDVSFIKEPSFEEILLTQKECDEFLEKRF